MYKIQNLDPLAFIKDLGCPKIVKNAKHLHCVGGVVECVHHENEGQSRSSSSVTYFPPNPIQPMNEITKQVTSNSNFHILLCINT